MQAAIVTKNCKSQKIEMFSKLQSLAYLEPSILFKWDDFWRFYADFRKNKTTKFLLFFVVPINKYLDRVFV